MAETAYFSTSWLFVFALALPQLSRYQMFNPHLELFSPRRSSRIYTNLAAAPLIIKKKPHTNEKSYSDMLPLSAAPAQKYVVMFIKLKCMNTDPLKIVLLIK